jgi:hypothetical protein
MRVEHVQRTGLNAGRTDQRQHKGICNPCIRAAHRLAILSAPVAWSDCRVHIVFRLNERPINASSSCGNEKRRRPVKYFKQNE